VEQRGIALTPQGRELYDTMNTQVDEKLAAGSGKTRVELAREVWAENLPNTEKGLREQGLGYFTYEVTGSAEPGEYDAEQLIDSGVLTAQPIVYEDFLPRSAAGIFQSNLKEEGTRDNEQQGTDYDLDTLSKIVGRDIVEPYELYKAQEEASLSAAAQQLGVTIHPTPALQS
ncbi:MAG: DUF1338 family protein, partial [Corynebacterium casei]|nr:DUF1338 family protein [Corynebacterium casei]